MLLYYSSLGSRVIREKIKMFPTALKDFERPAFIFKASGNYAIQLTNHPGLNPRWLAGGVYRGRVGCQRHSCQAGLPFLRPHWRIQHLRPHWRTNQMGYVATGDAPLEGLIKLQHLRPQNQSNGLSCSPRCQHPMSSEALVRSQLLCLICKSLLLRSGVEQLLRSYLKR